MQSCFVSHVTATTISLTTTNGKYYYIKDGDTVWNPGWKPTQTELDSYECRHGIGYSRFRSSKNGVKADLLAFVPMDATCEINKSYPYKRYRSGKTAETFLLCRVLSVECNGRHDQLPA